MRTRIVFYIPAIFFAVLYGWLMIAFKSVSPIPFVWMALFWASGFLLTKGKVWGGLLGILPGIHLMYKSTQDTGQVINIELPLGVIILIYYILCSGVVFYRRKSASR